MNTGAANNIIEKLALASRNARALPGSIVVRPATDTDRKIARAVLKTLHDNITPEMIAMAEGYSDFYLDECFDNSTEGRRAHMKMAIQTALATALKGERA